MTAAAQGEAALIWCPFPDEASACGIAAVMLDERLIACANMLPDVRSLFSWREERGDGSECGALLKTTAARLDQAMARLAALHPYDAPAVTGWTVRADPGTLRWLEEETRSR